MIRSIQMIYSTVEEANAKMTSLETLDLDDEDD